MHLIVGDHLGSSSVVINHANSRLVERTTYQPYGAVESDYRPAELKAFREPYKFTGKEEDIEVGATYFGARYYQPYLGRFMSADPLTIQALGSDLNPYAYVGGRVTSAVDPFGLCTPGAVHTQPDGTTVEVTECPPQNNSDRQAAQGEAMADFYGNRQLETLSGNGSGSTNALSRNNSNQLGIPPDGRTTDRVIKAPDVWDHPAFKKVQEVTMVAAAAAVAIYFSWPYLLGGGAGGALYARAIPPLVLSFYVQSGLFVGGLGGGGVGVVASNGSLGAYGMRTAPLYQGVYTGLRNNPGRIYELVPRLSLNFINLAARYTRLAPAVFGKAFELFSVRVTPNLYRALGGAYQPDAVIRVGNRLVNVDWTTWGQLESHLERAYYQVEPFIIYLHQGWE
jgi:RHS repeat-associated protein